MDNNKRIDGHQLTIPTYCEHYRKLLVEDIALAVHPASLPYGKCAVIGFLPPDGTVLESLKLPKLPPDLQLADGACKVNLNFDNFVGAVPRNYTVEICGYLKVGVRGVSLMESSRELAETLLELTDETQLRATFETMRHEYPPYIEVQTIRRVQHARELVQLNVELRAITKLLDAALH